MNRHCLMLGLEPESFQRAVTITLLPYTYKPEHYLHPLLKHSKPFLFLIPLPQQSQKHLNMSAPILCETPD